MARGLILQGSTPPFSSLKYRIVLPFAAAGGLQRLTLGSQCLHS